MSFRSPGTWYFFKKNSPCLEFSETLPSNVNGFQKSQTLGGEFTVRVVRPFCLLWRTKFVSKNIPNTNYESQRCVEIFLGALLHHQVVFKNSHFELFLRKSSKFGYQFQKNHHISTFEAIAIDLRVV